jgi:hypothetical protein
VLRTLDPHIIAAWATANGARVLSYARTRAAFWEAIHRARVACPELSEEEREMSRAWLKGFGRKPARRPKRAPDRAAGVSDDESV